MITPRKHEPWLLALRWTLEPSLADDEAVVGVGRDARGRCVAMADPSTIARWRNDGLVNDDDGAT